MLLVESTPWEACLDLVLIALLVLVLVVGEVLTVSAFLDIPSTPDPQLLRETLVPTICIRLIGICTVVALLLRLRRQRATSIGLGRHSLGLNVLIGIASVPAVYVVIMATMLTFLLFFPDLWEEMAENSQRLMELLPRLHPLGFAAVALFVGIYEEVLFRGFIMARMRRVTGSWLIALLLSTVVFTSLHAFDQTSAALVVVAILSLAFGALTVWRRSIIPAIVAHALYDLSQFLWLYLTAGDSWT